MAIDPTIALGIRPPDPSQQFNPLANIQSATQNANALIGFQNNQRQMAAQQAIGQAQQQATDPNTGVVDQGKFRALVASDPNAAYGAQSADTTSLGQQGAALGNEAQTLKNQGQKIGFLAGLTAPLAADPTTTKADVQNTIQHAVNFGLIDAPTAQSVLSSLPDDPAGVRSKLTGFLKSTMSPGEEYAHIYGTQSSINNGPNVISGVTGPADQGGGFSGSTATPLGIGPDAAATQAAGVGPNGAPTVTPLATRLGQEGVGGLVAPGGTTPVGTMGGKPTVPPGWNGQGAGRYPGAAPAAASTDFSGGASPATPAVAPASPSAAPGTPVQVGLAPGQADAMATTQRAGAEGAVSLLQSANATPDRLAILNNMLGDATTFTSGPGPQKARDIAATANNLFGTSIDEAGIESAQGFNKFSQQISNAQSTTLGAGSDAKLQAAMHANPNSSLQTNTNVQILHTLQGNEDAIQAKANAWNQSGLAQTNPGAYQQWSQNFNQNFDPRAYQLLRMSPEERMNMQSQMAKAGTLDAFRNSVNNMAARGLLPASSQGGAPVAATQPPTVPTGP